MISKSLTCHYDTKHTFTRIVIIRRRKEQIIKTTWKTTWTYQCVFLLADRAEIQTGIVSKAIKTSPVALNQGCLNFFYGGQIRPREGLAGQHFLPTFLRSTQPVYFAEGSRERLPYDRQNTNLGSRPRAMGKVLSGRILDNPALNPRRHLTCAARCHLELTPQSVSHYGEGVCDIFAHTRVPSYFTSTFLDCVVTPRAFNCI